jgi:hypothetical protein
MGALVAPPAMAPVLKPPPFCVAVWVRESMLCHATVCPTWTLAGFGVNELLPFIPVIVITTSAPLLIGLMTSEEPPQPGGSAMAKARTANSIQMGFVKTGGLEPLGSLPTGTSSDPSAAVDDGRYIS